MNFTQSQQNAIDVRDCSLIISAGAGSGKTAVLTERILSRICDENDDCNIDDFLVVTFTNAAAKELSDRIRKKLSQRASEDASNKKILNNIALLPLARISTINSFCYELVRDNFQKLGLSASVRIADEAEMSVIREKIMNEVIDDCFENKGDDSLFIAAYEIFSSAKNDKGFVDALLDLDNKLSSLSDPDTFCEHILSQYREIGKDTEFFDTQIGQRLRRSTVEKAEKSKAVFERLIGLCSGYDTLVKAYVPGLECEYDFARQIISACDRGYAAVKEISDTHEKVSLKAVRNFDDAVLKELVKGCKNGLGAAFRKELSEKYACSPEQLQIAAKDTANVLSVLFELVKEFRRRLTARKNELAVIEFSDAERYTLSLLVESVSPFRVTPLAMSMRQSFKEIYIDEYQDVNPLQDMIFRAISRHTPEDEEYSRFMVGDIKQSIYRFRGASSEIFMSYRDNFSDIEDGESCSKRIFMSDNFRCCESVIGLTNYVFEKLMGTYYSDGDRLCFSRQENMRVLNKACLCAFSYDKDTAEGMSAVELEAGIICKKIKEIVGNPAFTDSDGKTYTYGDIGILARSKSALKVYENILTRCGIPVSSDVGESFYGKKEILLCLDILNAVDNPERDIYLAGFMRSFAGGFTDDELAVIRKKYRSTSLYRAVISYAEKEDGNDAALSEKCSLFVRKLCEYRSYSRGKSADKLLWKLFGETDMLNVCCSDGFSNDRKGTRKNLLKLYQMARDFSKTSFRGVGAFIDYINSSVEADDIKSERDMTGDSVRLMTIHASKGLEFPVCFVSNLSKRFNKSDESTRLVFSERAGIAVTLCDTEAIEITDSNSGLVSINTPYKRLIGSLIDTELTDEEIRILYVALTRARDMLIMTGSFSKKIENAVMDSLVAHNTGEYTSLNNYLSMLFSVLCNQSAMSVYYDAAGINYTPTERDAEEYLECEYMTCAMALDALRMSETEETENTQANAVEVNADYELVERLTELSGHGKAISDLPSKITVSQLKKGLIDEERTATESAFDKAKDIDAEAEPVPAFMTDNKEADGAEKGTAMHMFMQFCDFDRCENDGCEAEAQRLCDNGFIDERQKGLLDFSRLSGFFGSDFYRQIKNSKTVYREQRFNLYSGSFEREDSRMFDDGVLVQGVIDLFFENGDGTYTVVDFKTDRVFGKGAEQILIDRHKEQLMYYKRAVEEMTEKSVSKAVIYSFSLMREIDVE